ncbi:MAG: PD-(D/E)XK nuclease family protein, partial [Actinomycetota bacterium]
FLDHEAHADAVRSSATAFGSIVHAIADHVARGEIPEDLRSMEAFVDRVWSEVDFDAPWRSMSERTEARHALERFLIYHQARERTFIDSERYIVSDLDVPTSAGAPESVHLRGYLDRIEEDDDGRLVAIDFKTSSSSPTKKETQEHGQLGVYQLLLRDAYEAADGSHHDVGGAALVQLRIDASAKDPGPKQQMQPPLTPDATAVTDPTDDPRGSDGPDEPDGPESIIGVTWIERALGEAADTVRRERIEARAGKHCTFCDFASLCPAKTPEVSVVDLVGDVNEAVDVGGDDE